jgi:hypothetical protein
MLKLIDYLNPRIYLVRETDQQPAIIGHVNYLINAVKEFIKPLEVISVAESANTFTVDRSKGEIFKLVASSTGSKVVNIIKPAVGTMIIHYKKEGAAAGAPLDITFNGVNWPSGAAPVATGVDGHADIFTITFDGVTQRGIASLDYPN